MIASTLLTIFAATAFAGSSFYLEAHSGDAAVDGQRFGTCHVGAAIESICLFLGDTQVFQLNSTSDQMTFPPGVLAEGDLTWLLPISGGQLIPQAASLNAVPGSNVAAAIFGFATPVNLAISSDMFLGFLSGVNDTVSPPQSTQATFLSYWHVCENNFNGYIYETLAWVYGGGQPTQPACKQVDLKVVYT